MIYRTLDQRYQRLRLRSGPQDGRRLPYRSEGITLAKKLLIGISNKEWLEFDWDQKISPVVLAKMLLPPIGSYTSVTLQEYINLGEAIPAYWDALPLISKNLSDNDMAKPALLLQWHFEVAQGRRTRPV